MQPTGEEKQFLKDYKDVLSGIFKKRIEELKEEMVLEPNEVERNKIRELIIEFKRWLADIKIITGDKEIKKDTGI